MDGRGETGGSEQLGIEAEGSRRDAAGARPEGARPAPTWRAWLLSIVAAVVLSAAATLLLGGSFRLPGASGAAAGRCGSGAGGPCCPPQDEAGR